MVVLSWNDLPLLRATLETFRQFNGSHDMYVVDNGSVDGTGAYLENDGYRVIHHEQNLGVFEGTMSGWTRAVADGHEFILNLQSDFPSLCAVPFAQLEGYLDRNPDVGFIRLNRRKHRPVNSVTHDPVIFQPPEAVGEGFEVSKYNYHMAFHPYLFRASLVEHLRQAPVKSERGLMCAYEGLNLWGAKLRPPCFETLPCNRHGTPGWTP
ncbi:MAG: hypothetical protein QOF78_1838 [Phycisphaerales bacterium]|nr:hypothetical protein [Phycisphaerales bacterium]